MHGSYVQRNFIIKKLLFISTFELNFFFLKLIFFLRGMSTYVLLEILIHKRANERFTITHF